MDQVVLNGCMVGVIVVVLCTSSIAERLRKWALSKTKVLECAFCTSVWVSLLVDPSRTYFTTVTVANIVVMLIHWSIATQTQEDQA